MKELDRQSRMLQQPMAVSNGWMGNASYDVPNYSKVDWNTGTSTYSHQQLAQQQYVPPSKWAGEQRVEEVGPGQYMVQRQYEMSPEQFKKYTGIDYSDVPCVSPSNEEKYWKNKKAEYSDPDGWDANMSRTQSVKSSRIENIRKLFWYRFLKTGELPFNSSLVPQLT